MRQTIREEYNFHQCIINIKMYGHLGAIFVEPLRAGGERTLLLVNPKRFGVEALFNLHFSLSVLSGSLTHAFVGKHLPRVISAFVGTSAEQIITLPCFEFNRRLIVSLPQNINEPGQLKKLVRRHEDGGDTYSAYL